MITEVESQRGVNFETLRGRFSPRIVLVTDFGNSLAGAECELAIERTFQEQGGDIPRLTSVCDVRPFNKVDAAFTLGRLAAVAPPGTIFVGVVDPGVGTKRDPIIVATRDQHFFVEPNNGIFYPIVNSEGVLAVWRIREEQHLGRSTTFHGRDIFSPVAAQLACGVSVDLIGERIDEERLVKFGFEENQVVHTDYYGNLKINCGIPEGAMSLVLGGLENGELNIPVCKTFEDVKSGELLGYLGSSNLLEIAVREGSAVKLLAVEVGNRLKIDWRFSWQ